MAKKIIISLLICTQFCGFCLAQQRNYDQELYNLLAQEKIIDAVDYYNEYSDSIYYQQTRDYFQINFDIAYNRYERAIDSLSAFIDKYCPDDEVRLSYLLWQVNLCFLNWDYQNGVNTFDKTYALLQSNPELLKAYKTVVQSLMSLRNLFYELAKYPKMQITNVADNEESVEIEIDTLNSILTFPAQYNNQYIKTMFDTGNAFPLFLDRKNAEMLGIRELGTLNNNGKDSVSIGIIDSIRIGNLLITNAMAAIMNDNYSKRCVSDTLDDREAVNKINSIEKQIQIILGMPIIRQLHRIDFDLLNNKMVISNRNQNGNSNKSNIYLKNQSLYLQAFINGINFTSFIDTGGANAFLYLYNAFQKKHSGNIIVNDTARVYTESECLVDGSEYVKYLLSAPCKFSLDDKAGITEIKTAVLQNSDVKIAKFAGDAYLGYGFLKKNFSRFSFNFDSMRFECE
ncbi:MAG: retropepsin-like domain-containing protein [Dysgonamonadaceae bacterium]|jgi:hypothetical protein|nr:retropepsin-like domain-containing protein [Dysgonamonadaceae bacterium]